MDDLTTFRERCVNFSASRTLAGGLESNPVSEIDALDRAAALAETDAEAAVDGLGWLAAAIEADRDAGRFALWGASTAIDENVGAPVIGRLLFDELHRRAGLTATWPIGNAGLVHCYGYLLSLVPTPYGLKRERWLGAGLARAYGVPDDAFVPWSGTRTLLTRATDAASALLSTPALSRTLRVDGRETRVALSATTGPGALAYAVAADAAPLLVTTFPVADAAALITEFDADPRLHWNAA